MIHTTCPNSFCGYKKADLHDDGPTHVIIYCQGCGYEAKHTRARRRPVNDIVEAKKRKSPKPSSKLKVRKAS